MQQCEVYHIGLPDLLPSFSEELVEGVHRVCFDTQKQLDEAVNGNKSSVSEKKLYKRHNRTKLSAMEMEFR
jgi:hypothetical protein